jgi:hypothetical protein
MKFKFLDVKCVDLVDQVGGRWGSLVLAGLRPLRASGA